MNRFASSSSSQRTAAVFFCLITLGVFLFDTLGSLHRSWTTAYSYTHGYLTVVAAIWIAVVRWRRRPHRDESLKLIPLIALTLVTAAIAISLVLSIDVVQHALLPLFLGTLVSCLFGPSSALRIAPALALLYFGLPIWNSIVPFLQSLTTSAVSVVLLLHEFPVQISGNVVAVPAGTFEIAEGCSGLHYWLVGMILGVTVASLDAPNVIQASKIVVVAALLGVVANWMRVYALILVGQYTEMQHFLIRDDHYYFGWIVFGLAMAVFLLIVRRWTRVTSSSAVSDVRNVSAPGDNLARGLLVVGLVVLVFHAAVMVAVSTKGTVGPVRMTVHPAITIYESSVSGWRPVHPNAHVFAEGAAVYEGMTAEWFIAAYTVMGPKADIASSTNMPFGDTWSVAESLALQPGFRIDRIRAIDQGNRLVATRTRVAGQNVNSRLEAKWIQLLGLRMWRRDADFVAISVPCRNDCSTEFSRFSELAIRWFPTLEIDV